MTTHDPTIHDGPRQPDITTPAGRPTGEPAVWLLPLDVPDVAALAASPAAFATDQCLTIDAGVLDELSTQANQTAELYASAGITAPWGSFLGVSSAGHVVGLCSFLGPPDSGTVEIAYVTFKAARGRGVATAMASALLAMARRSGWVDTVFAHTLAEAGASTRILDGLGFTASESVEDSEDRSIWRWTIDVRGGP